MKCTHCSNEIKPVVCVDIDGTMADYHGHFLKFACDWLGLPDDSKAMTYDGCWDLATHLDVTRETYRQIKLAFRQGGMKRSMPAYPEAARLTRSLQQMGVELWLTTTRPYLRLDNVDPDTRFWLDRNNIRYDYLFYDENKYMRLLDQVDKARVVCVLDDEIEQVFSAKAVGLTPIWRRTSYNVHTPGVVVSCPEAHSLSGALGVIGALVSNWRIQNP